MCTCMYLCLVRVLLAYSVSVLSTHAEEYQRKRDDVAMKAKFVQAIKEVEKKSDVS